MKKRPQQDLVNASFNLPRDVSVWLSEYADTVSTTKTSVLVKTLQDAMNEKGSGFRTDVEWILRNKISYHKRTFGESTEFHWKYEDVENYGDFTSGYSLSLDEEPPLGYVLAAENTRNNLRQLFADAVMFYMEKMLSVILLIPYRLDPTHKVWTALKKHDGIQVCTPETLVDEIEGLMAALPDDWNEHIRLG